MYSNQPEVELFANGVSLGKQTSAEHFFYFQVPNTGEMNLLAVAGECRDESFIRKVETFNEEYRLKEKGAVLNWFDITAPEGYFSLNDKMGEIMQSEEGKKLFQKVFAQMSQGTAREGKPMFQMSEEMLKMMGSFTVLRLLNLMSVAGVKATKEQLLDLNGKLNQIKK